MLSIFELVKSVLDDEYELIVPAATREAIVLTEFQRLSIAYSELERPNGTSPDYKKHETRFAYIYKYTTCHANIVAHKIREVPALQALFNSDWIDVTAIGGGPGSDFLGVVKHMLSCSAKGGLKCYVLDREVAWGDTWSDVERRATGLPFPVSTHAQHLDVTDDRTWMTQTRYLAADLFTFIYFFSEIYRLKDQADRFFVNLMTRAKPGSLFLFVDNNRNSFATWFDDLASRHQLTYIDGGPENFRLDYTEEKMSLEPYWSSFSSHNPKLSAAIAWRVYRKP